MANYFHTPFFYKKRLSNNNILKSPVKHQTCALFES